MQTAIAAPERLDECENEHVRAQRLRKFKIIQSTEREDLTDLGSTESVQTLAELKIEALQHLDGSLKDGLSTELNVVAIAARGFRR